MRDFARNCFGFCLMLGLFLGLAWLAGITSDGIDDHCDSGDHPTNWYDTAEHPEAR